jgi:RimJ/RimL family protein N-acetyltransferase
MHCPAETRVAELADDASVRARIIVNAAGKPAGFMAISDHDGWLAEIHSIVVAQPGAGVGRWALREALRWAFEDVGAHRVWLEVTAANANARRLYESEGFVHEGTYRDGYRSGAGAYEDLAHYGMLEAEWQLRRA